MIYIRKVEKDFSGKSYVISSTEVPKSIEKRDWNDFRQEIWSELK